MAIARVLKKGYEYAKERIRNDYKNRLWKLFFTIHCECESCEGCQFKNDCCPKASKNRTIRRNQELTCIHQEVITNLESIHGALLRMNRSIQAEGTFGILNLDKSYKRLF